MWVAAAAFAAAAIAKAGPTMTSMHPTRYGIAGFAVGFALIYDPGIMPRGSLIDIVTATGIQIVALALITPSHAGYLFSALVYSPPDRDGADGHGGRLRAWYR